MLLFFVIPEDIVNILISAKLIFMIYDSYITINIIFNYYIHRRVNISLNFLQSSRLLAFIVPLAPVCFF